MGMIEDLKLLGCFLMVYAYIGFSVYCLMQDNFILPLIPIVINEISRIYIEHKMEVEMRR